jgi:hypothetical protein
MDYSVLVAVDSVKNELVIGIVGSYFLAILIVLIV